jgi:glyoxylase-like metal-dependent hydrolase (beta-lactamase superfamily II)
LQLGRYELHAVRDGTFALDGGAMFGIVPRPLWERKIAPDARNRIPLAVRCLLAIDRAAKRVVLVDDGMGDKWDAKRIDIYGIDKSAGDLLGALRRLGVEPADVTDVILTHLHFDHAGGTTRVGAGGRLELVFPRAVHHVQRRHWQWAQGPSEKDAGSFLPEDFGLLQHSNQLHLVDGTPELLPDLELILSDGHTTGLQLPRFHGGGTHLTFCGDLIPTAAHLRPSWVMAYDLSPLTTIDEKKVLAAGALEDDGILFFEHDPAVTACRVEERDGATVFKGAVDL